MCPKLIQVIYSLLFLSIKGLFSLESINPPSGVYGHFLEEPILKISVLEKVIESCGRNFVNLGRKNKENLLFPDVLSSKQ